jgi:transcriptional regulator with XRE-family HTH domain
MNIFPDINQQSIDNFYIQVGRNVKRLREKAGFSQLELAISIGHKSASFLSNCESYKNKEHFNLEHLFLIANVLNINICELIVGENHQ